MKQIEHSGTVIKVTPEEYVVELLSRSACASCHARSICNPSDQKTKTVNVKRRNGDVFELGEEVNIIMRTDMGMKAVLIAYVIPLVILLILLLYLQFILNNELISGLISIGFVLGYFFVIYLLRNRLGRKFVFTIEHKT